MPACPLSSWGNGTRIAGASGPKLARFTPAIGKNLLVDGIDRAILAGLEPDRAARHSLQSRGNSIDCHLPKARVYAGGPCELEYQGAA